MSGQRDLKKLPEELSDMEMQTVAFLDQWTKLAGAREIHVDQIRKHFSRMGCKSPDETASILESYGILKTKATGKIRRYIVLDSESATQRSIALSAPSDRFFEITGIAHVLTRNSGQGCDETLVTTKELAVCLKNSATTVRNKSRKWPKPDFAGRGTIGHQWLWRNLRDAVQEDYPDKKIPLVFTPGKAFPKA